jgi:hypothetical protein
MADRSPHAWARVAFSMFAVGWGANQFSPMLIVYRHELGLSALAVAGLFAIYAATLIPGLLIGGPASDRFGRRVTVLPFVILSPAATALLIAGSHSLPLIAAGRALAGLCSGVVFGSATAWVHELSGGSHLSARRAALALSAGFGLGPLAAALLAQWAAAPLVIPYLPHLVIGTAAVLVLLPTPDTRVRAAAISEPRRRIPGAVRGRAFWLTVAPAAPLVFGTVSIAIVVLPEEVTSARTLSAGFAGLMTALAFGPGIAIQPLARRAEARRRFAGLTAGLCCAAAGAGLGAGALSFSVTGSGAARTAAGAAAVLLGLAYGMILVSGLQRASELARPDERGAVVACYYVIAYLGFGAPYLVQALNAAFGRQGTFAALACASVALAGWMGAHAVRAGREPAREVKHVVTTP